MSIRLKSVLAALVLLGASPALPRSAQAATQYPLTLRNCGVSVTFDHAPARIVSIGQSNTEILLSLGLGDRVVGTAVWFEPVLPQFEAVNAKIKRLANNDPSFESVVAQEPDLVTAQYEGHVGPKGSVATREQFRRCEDSHLCGTRRLRREGQFRRWRRGAAHALQHGADLSGDPRSRRHLRRVRAW